MINSPQIIIEGRSINIYENCSSCEHHLTEDGKLALEFCRKWLRGDEVFTVQTSGSTGEPKQQQLTRTQMIESARMTGKALRIEAGGELLVCLSPRYIAGLMMLVRGLVLGLTIIVVPVSANPLLSLPDIKKFTIVSFVPYQLYEILDSPQKELLSRFQYILIGGAPLDDRLLKRVQGIQTPVYHTYGMTETVSHIALRLLNGNKPEQYFTPLPGVEIELDERKCLRIRSVITRFEWVQTNDIVELLSGGCFEYIGRIDNSINSGGVKVQAEKIEAAIWGIVQMQDSPDLTIHNICVTGLPDEQLGEEVCAIFEGQGSLPGIVQLHTLLQTPLQKFELPRVYFIMNKIPQTNNGKPDRRVLRELLLTRNIYQQFRIKL